MRQPSCTDEYYDRQKFVEWFVMVQKSAEEAEAYGKKGASIERMQALVLPDKWMPERALKEHMASKMRMAEHAERERIAKKLQAVDAETAKVPEWPGLPQ